MPPNSQKNDSPFSFINLIGKKIFLSEEGKFLNKDFFQIAFLSFTQIRIQGYFILAKIDLVS